MKKSTVFVLSIAVCICAVGCGKTINIKFPFEFSDVENIEMFHFVDPTHAKKKLITKQGQMEEVYQSLERISLKDKETEPAVGGSVTSFRFHLSDGTTYEVIYSLETVKSGRIQTTGSEKDYFTSADIGGYWKNYGSEVADATEDELPALYQEKTEE